MSKIDYTYVSTYFQEKNCKLLETEYVDDSTSMRYLCSCGNESRISWHHFINRKGYCKKCRSKYQRSNFEDIQSYFLSQNCVLLETQYQNAHVPMKYICSCGNESKICWTSFREGSRCQVCGYKKRVKTRHPDREKLKLNRKISQRCRTLVRRTLRRTRQSKNKSSKNLLGYSGIELKNRLTSHPHWEKVKNGHWAIDHIFPVKAFLDHGIRELKLINDLDNLRPLSASENSLKSHKYCKEDFLLWLKIKYPGLVVK